MIWIGALLIGTLIGVLTGMFGVGGGFLMTPLLNIVLGLPASIAVGTGVMQILGVSTAGLYRRRHEGQTDYKMAIVLFGGNYAGVRLGVKTLESLKSLGDIAFNGTTMPAADFYLLCIFLILLGLIAGWLLYDTSRNKGEEGTRIGLFSRIKLPPYTDFPSLDHPRLSIPVMSYFGLAVGFLTGLLGIGGGVILLPALVYLVGMRTHCATATSLAMVWLTAFVATSTHAAAGNSDIMLVIPLLLGGTVGLQIGVSLCSKLGGTKLRRYFCFVVIAAMIIVAAKLMTVAL
jgi:uncharacterized membrane protein YfcA